MAEHEELLICQDLTVGYADGRQCSGISFSLSEGDYLCVIGHEGTGKSALVSAVMGLVKPISGTLTYKNGLKTRQIGCMPQNAPVPSDATVQDVVLRGCLNRTGRFFVGRREREIVQQVLTRLGIASLSKRKCGELSGGGHRRVMLARALCGAERMLILDEPGYGLDVIARAELLRTIAEVHRDGLAVIVIGTDGMADATHVLHLLGDRVFFGTKEEYAASEPGQYYAAGRIV